MAHCNVQIIWSTLLTYSLKDERKKNHWDVDKNYTEGALSDADIVPI